MFVLLSYDFDEEIPRTVFRGMYDTREAADAARLFYDKCENFSLFESNVNEHVRYPIQCEVDDIYARENMIRSHIAMSKQQEERDRKREEEYMSRKAAVEAAKMRFQNTLADIDVGENKEHLLALESLYNDCAAFANRDSDPFFNEKITALQRSLEYSLSILKDKIPQLTVDHIMQICHHEKQNDASEGVRE